MEAVVKIIGKGFIKNNLGPVKPYIKNSWNQLDFFVVICSTLDLVFIISKVDMTGFQALKALRALRALRPLRVISKDEGMKLVVMSLTASLPSVANVLLVASLFLLVFSIMGVNYFKGAFWRCENPTTHIIDMSKIKTRANCDE